jgi:prepilin-type processing-associated H-X9-DG protein
MTAKWRIEWIWAGTATVLGCGLIFFGRPLIADRRNSKECPLRLKLIGLAMMQYSRDYDEKLLLRNNWTEALYPYSKLTPDGYQCPARTDLVQSYAMHDVFVGGSQAEFSEPQKTIFAFDADGGNTNAVGGAALLPKIPRHQNAHGILYFDGHTALVACPDFNAGYNLPELLKTRRELRLREQSYWARKSNAIKQPRSKSTPTKK